MSLLDTASLIVTPNGYKEGTLYSVIPSDGSGDMSVVRATTATRVNSAGLVELVPYNLLSYSEQFNNGVWGAVDTTITANTTTAPNGTLTADTMTITSSTSRTFQTTSLGKGTYTASVYIKALSGTPTIQFRMVVDGNDITDSIPTTTEWLRHDFTFTASTSMDYFVLRGESGTGSVAIWGAQLVEGSNALDYQKTETRLNIPRLDYSNGTCPSLLVEPQRTNTLFYSEQFDNAYWSKGNTSITVNAVNSPSGILNADKLVENSANSNHIVESLLFTSIGQPYTASIYFKKSERNYAFVGVFTSEIKQVFVNLTTGAVTNTVGTILSSNVETLDNGWFRVSLTFTATAAVYAFYGISDNGTNFSYQGDGTSGAFIWGAQLEAGSYPTSYIPTTSASVTRNADVVSKTGISSLIGQTEGTMFLDVDFTEVSDYNGWFMKDVANFDTFAFIQRENTGIIAVGYYGSGALQARIETAPSQPIGRYKIGFGYKNNDFVLYINGTQIGTDTSGSVSGLMNFLDAHYSSTGSTLQNAIALWKTRLTNTQLAQLTTI
jgi:hypothetical protein